MNVPELIIAKRSGQELQPASIQEFIREYVAGSIPDYQVSAFLMAVFFRGMTPRETAAYTRAMIESGQTYKFPNVPGVKVDKHSTGGVGDKVSLPLAPLVAACGVPVPMMSGRGLGHTGGTLDKLESLPGFRVDLSREAASRQLETLGFFMIGQTQNVAPADKKLYALRDVTGTVESIPLICGSILSKKVAAGVEALVMDVKTGSGAFMQSLEDSLALARSLVAIGTELGLRMSALITDMSQPLGRMVGNACEMRETIDCLRGGGPPDLREITLTFASEMVVLGHQAPDLASARKKAEAALDGGAALERFRKAVELQGGDPAYIDHPERLLPAPDEEMILAPRSGFLSAFRTRDIGVACNALGAGRTKVTDPVDPAVGLEVFHKLGAKVEKNEPLFRIWHRAGRGLDEARHLLAYCFTLADAPPQSLPALVVQKISPSELEPHAP